ncbi:MAG: recombinase family protein [Eubacteriales bacterium]|nr:recombinase family protein [Eubacteriales bacterium]
MRSIRKFESIYRISSVPRSKLKVAAYCRVSSANDEQMGSLSFQQKYYWELIDKNAQWELVGIYADHATGRNIYSRPQFRQLLADCRAGKINLIITKSISRFARNTLDVLSTCQDLKKMGVDVYFEVERIWLSKQTSDLILTIYAACYQNESEDRSFSIKWGIKRSFESVDSKFFNRICYGYQKGPDGLLVIKENEANIIRDIFRLYLDGHSIRQLIDELFLRNIPSPRGYDHWGTECISKILSNEKYTGSVLLGKTYVANFFDGKQVKNNGEEFKYLVSECHPMIIHHSIFSQVQIEKMKRSNRQQIR